MVVHIRTQGDIRIIIPLQALCCPAGTRGSVRFHRGVKRSVATDCQYISTLLGGVDEPDTRPHRLPSDLCSCRVMTETQESSFDAPDLILAGTSIAMRPNHFEPPTTNPRPRSGNSAKASSRPMFSAPAAIRSRDDDWTSRCRNRPPRGRLYERATCYDIVRGASTGAVRSG